MCVYIYMYIESSKIISWARGSIRLESYGQLSSIDKDEQKNPLATSFELRPL